MEWSQKKTIQFIECYRSYTFLWDTKHECYKNKIKRHNALLEIAAKFDLLKAEVERKIKNLQSHFLREYKRVQIVRKSGADDKLNSKWFAYSSLLFLLSRPERIKPSKSLNSKTIIETYEDVEKLTTGNSIKTDESEIGSPKGNNRKQIRNLQNINKKVTDAYTIMKEVYSKGYERDEFSLFGDQVAVKLKKITSPYARVTVQNRINTLLMEAELGVYDCIDYDKRKSNRKIFTRTSRNASSRSSSESSGSITGAEVEPASVKAECAGWNEAAVEPSMQIITEWESEPEPETLNRNVNKTIER